MLRHVIVKLGGEVSLITNINASKIETSFSNLSPKGYSFLYNYEILPLEVGDLVVVQVKNTYTIGQVESFPEGEELLYEEFIQNAITETSPHKLVVGYIDNTLVKKAIRARRIYALEERKIQEREKINQEALQAALDAVPEA